MLLRTGQLCSLMFFWIQYKCAAPVGERAFRACKSYGQSMLECHNVLYPSEKVRVPVDLLLYPHMVLIGFRKSIEEPLAWKCGGTLLSEAWVLTAAHCVEDPFSGPARVLRVGTATFEFNEVEGLDQERNIRNVIVHPGWKPPSKYHDLALMQADPSFILSRDIRIACLALRDVIGDVKLTATGFGSTRSEAAIGSQTLMTVDMDMVDNSVCNRSVKFMIKRKILAHGITDNQLCAGDYENGGRDTCQGDSGGPLQIMEEKADCIKSFPLHTVVGVTSFGRDCGRKMAPGVYTKVSKYIDWIETIVWPE